VAVGSWSPGLSGPLANMASLALVCEEAGSTTRSGRGLRSSEGRAGRHAGNVCACGECGLSVGEGDSHAVPKDDARRSDWARHLKRKVEDFTVSSRVHRRHWYPNKIQHGKRVRVDGPPSRPMQEIRDDIARDKAKAKAKADDDAKIADCFAQLETYISTRADDSTTQSALRSALAQIKQELEQKQELATEAVVARDKARDQAKRHMEWANRVATREAAASSKAKDMRLDLREMTTRLKQAESKVHFSFNRFINDSQLQTNMHQWVFYHTPEALDSFVKLILELCPESTWNWYTGTDAARVADLIGEDRVETDDITRGDAGGGEDEAELCEDEAPDSGVDDHSDDDSGQDRHIPRPGRKHCRGNRAKVSAADAIVLYLTVTKAGLTMRRAASLFGVSEYTAGRAFITALDVLHFVLQECMSTLATEKLHKLIPERVREALETSGEDADVNPVHLLDAFEAFTEAPFGDLARAILWSAVRCHLSLRSADAFCNREPLLVLVYKTFRFPPLLLACADGRAVQAPLHCQVPTWHLKQRGHLLCIQSIWRRSVRPPPNGDIRFPRRGQAIRGCPRR